MGAKSTESSPLLAEDLPAIPRCWRWVRLKDVAEIRLGKMLSRKAYTEGLIQLPYLRNQNVRWHAIDFSDLKEMGFQRKEMERYSVQDGDLLVCEGGEPGRCAVYHGSDGPLMYQKALHRVRPKNRDLDVSFLQYYITRYISDPRIFPRKSETTIQHLPLEKLKEIPVSLPSPQKQRQIVDRIEELFSKLEAGVAALRRARANLKRYRASVLKAAVEGRLTADWRRRHPDVEPASKLLQRILRERRRRWEEAQKAKIAARHGGILPSSFRLPPYKEPSTPSPEFLAQAPPLPKTWCWATVAQLLLEPPCNGISVKGSNNPPGVPALRLSAMGADGFDYSDRRYIPITATVASRLAIRVDDFFVSRGSGTLALLGRGTLAQSPGETVVFPDTMIRLRFLGNALLKHYIATIWESQCLRARVTGKARTTAGIYKVSQKDLEEISIPLPPMREQTQLVDSVHRSLSTEGCALREIHNCAKRAASLRKLILINAFGGLPKAQRV